VPDLGLTLRVKVGASNTGGVAGPVESAATGVITAPPSGGGDPGGGGGGSNDLVVTATVDRTSASVGGSYVWRITVTNAGGGIAFGVNVDVAMSANLVYGFSQVNRGNGCKPAATAGHYTCNLDLLGPSGASSAVGQIVFGTNVAAAGQVSLTATASFADIDPTPANNTVTITANNSTPPVTPTPKPTLPAPKLTRTGTATVKPVHLATKTTVGFGVKLNRAASVTMTVKVKGGTRSMLLRAGSKVGSKTSTRSGTSLTANRAAGSFAVKAVVGKSAFVKGTSYVVTLVAKAPDGRKSTLTVTFKG